MLKKILLFSISIIIFAAPSLTVWAAYPPQCEHWETDPQTGCTHNKDAEILESQCKKYYSAEQCGSMQNYLKAMSSQCSKLNPVPTGVNCGVITADGFYGREAYEYADYVEKNLGIFDTSTSAAPATNNTGEIDFPDEYGLPDPEGGIVAIVVNFLEWLLGILGILALIAFVISGLQYFFAAGNERTIENAKRNMMYSIIGVIVALSGFVVIKAIDAALRATTSLF